MTLPPGPWTAEVMKEMIARQVDRHRAKLKEIRRSVENAQVVQAVAVGAQKEKGA